MAQLVSILIPAYNAEKWIADTVRSALDQTWPKKEIIIVDDGSSDNTLELAKNFESKTVKVMTQENAGACSARNKALSVAQGKYIQWLDADDILAPDKISEQIKKSDTIGDELVLFSSAYGIFFYRKEKALFNPHSLWQNLLPVDWLIKKFTENVWVNPAVWLLSRKLADLIGPWEERLSLDDDGEYFCRAVSRSKEIKFVPEARIFYRQSNPRSLSKSRSEKACRSLLLSLTLCIDYLRKLEDSERTRSASLKYLQTWFSYFYLGNAELLEGIQRLAREMGGSLVAPAVSLKYLPIKSLFGWKTAMETANAWRKLKFLVRNGYDKFIFDLSNALG